MAISGLYNAETYGVDITGAVAANTALQSALDAAGNAGGGMVFIPEGTVYLNPATTVLVPDMVTVVGAGRGTIITGGETTLTTTSAMFAPKTNGARCEFRDMDWKGAAAGTDPNIQWGFKTNNNMTAGSYLRLENVNTSRFLYAVNAVTPPSSTSAFDVIAEKCSFTGFGSATPSNGIAHVATSGSCRVRDCLFTQLGKTSDVHHHGMYIGASVNLDVDGCHFIDMEGDGWGVMHYNGDPAGTTAAYSRVRNSYFDTRGVSTSERNGLRHLVENCRFTTDSPAVNIRGEGLVHKCDITVNGLNTDVGVLTSPGDVTGDGFTEPLVILDVVDCTFRGSSDSDIEFNAATTGGNANNGRAFIRGNRFFGQAGTANVRMRTGTSIRLHAVDNEFKGGASDVSIMVTDGTFSQIIGNVFDQAVASHHINHGDTGVNENIALNLFIQGTATGGSTPTTRQYFGNEGSTAPADAEA